jgi:acetyl esterase/lipase
MLAAVSITRDVIYGHKAGMALTYDVFRPRNANGAAVINMISGGWVSTWAEPNSRVRGYQPLLEKGVTVLALHHGSAPQFKVPDAAADIRRGVRHIKLHAREYGIDPARVGAWGASAGGHLSLVAGFMADGGDPAAADPVLRQENHIKTVVAYFPPTDMTLFIPVRRNVASLDYPDELAPTISPVRFVEAGDPPTLIITGDADTTVNVRHSHLMKEAMDKAGVENVLTIFPGANHGFAVPSDRALQARYQAEASSQMVAWFVQRL